MRPRLLLSLGAIAVIGLLTVVIVASSFPSPSPSQPTASSSPTPTAPGQQGPPLGKTFPDFVVDPAIVKAPTSSAAQSKLWFAAGAWWGVLFTPVGDRQTIFRLDPATQVWADTGTLVDERVTARTDTLWDGTHLYVLSGGSRPTPSHAIRVRRYAFDPKGQRFVLDPGFPVTISANGASPAVITKDSKGVAWVAFTQEGRVWLSHTLDSDVHWTAPVASAAPEAIVDPTDVASIAAFGPGKVAVVWTNVLKSAVYASVHDDGTADDAWSSPETVYGATGVDNELSLAAYPLAGAGGATGLAAAVSTALDQGDAVRQLDPLTLLATRAADGTWTTNLVGLVRDRHARPIVLVDPHAGMVYVAATSPGNGGTIYYKRAPIDRIEFDTGRGTPLLTSTTDLQLDGVTSTKGLLSAESGLVALAADRTTGRFSHAFVDLGGGVATADPADPKRPRTPSPAPAVAVAVLRDDFEAWPIGRANAGWYVRPEDPQGRLSIVDEGGGRHALRVPSAKAGVRACRDIPQLPGTRVTVELRVRVSRAGASDAVLVSVRGSGGEAGSVRVTTRGVFGWYAGPTKVRSTIPFRGHAWYRVRVTFDQARRTYDLRVWNAANRPVAGRTGLRWRTPDVKVVDSVCVETAAGAPAQVVDVAGVNVQVPAS
jgi:hypothetical protein